MSEKLWIQVKPLLYRLDWDAAIVAVAAEVINFSISADWPLLPKALGFLLPFGTFYAVYAQHSQRSSPFPKYVTKQGAGHESKFDTLEDIMRENYAKDRDHIYLVEHPHKDVTIILAKHVDELMQWPDEKVNFLEDINDRFLGEYNKMLAPGGIHDETLTYTIKNNLTPNLGIIMQDLQEEVGYAVVQEIGECKDWTPLYPMTALIRIIALVSGRIFIGPELNRNEEYFSCSLDFAVQAFNVIPPMRKYPKWLRPIAQYWVPECRPPLASIRTMKRLLKPILSARLASDTKLRDMLTWILGISPPGRAGDLTWQAMYQLQIAAAAMHTTSNTMAHIFFDLAAHPEYLELLREEIVEVQRTEPLGILSKPSMARLRKMNSFMMESQRLNPFSITGFSRKMKADVAMKDGTVFPEGATVTVPVSCIASDPAIYPDPDTFDGLRFYKLRTEAKGNDSKHQYVNTNKEYLYWGHGVHACPGIFFAANEIKIILVHLLMNYDIKLQEGEVRPANLFTEGGMIPNPQGKVWLKARR